MMHRGRRRAPAVTKSSLPSRGGRPLHWGYDHVTDVGMRPASEPYGGHAASVRRYRSSLLALPLVLGSLLPLGSPRPVAAVTTLTPAWTASTPQAPILSGSPQAFAGAGVGDLFGDGRQEVVAGFPDGSVWAWDANGNLLPGWPRHTSGAIHSSPTLVDLQHTGHMQVIATSEDGSINVWNGDGSEAPGWPRQAYRGQVFGFGHSFFGGAAAGDLFGDGNLEVVAAGWDHFLYAWGANGSLLGGYPINLWDTVWDTPALVDLEHNGTLDIVIGSDSNGGTSEPYPQGGVYWAFRPGGCYNENAAVHCQVPGWPRWIDQVPWGGAAAAPMLRDGVTYITGATGHYLPEPHGNYITLWNQNGADGPNWTTNSPRTGDRNFAAPAIGDLYGDGNMEIVESSEDGHLYGWNPRDGSLLGGFGSAAPCNGCQVSNPIIAPIDGSGHNGIWVEGGTQLMGYDNAGHQILSGQMGGQGWAAPTVADLGNGHLSAIAVAAGDLSNSWWKVSVFAIPGATTLPPLSWPTYHGSMTRAGSMAPSAHMIPISAPSTTSVPVSWASDTTTIPVREYDVWVRDGTGPWTPWIRTGATSHTFYGTAGHTYSFFVRALAASGASGAPGVGVVSVTIPGGAPRSQPAAGLYGVNAYGFLHPGSSPPLPVSASWPGWRIVRGISVLPGGQGGLVLDGWGGLHPFGATGGWNTSGGPYWAHWDIARAVVARPAGGGYILDGWGGVHPFGGAPAVSISAYWSGWDIARGLVLTSSGNAGYVLDGWGGVHPFAASGTPVPGVMDTGGAYWSGWDIARGIVLAPDDQSGRILDGWGGVHTMVLAGQPWPGGSSTSAYWGGWDIARGITLQPGSASAGWVLDGYGAFHPFGGAPPVDSTYYTPWDDSARASSGSN